jgi:hypothetical protein
MDKKSKNGNFHDDWIMQGLAANPKLYNEIWYISNHVELDMDKISNNGNFWDKQQKSASVRQQENSS